MNYDLRTLPDDGSKRMLNALEQGTVLPVRWPRLECLESGTVILECKDGKFEPIGAEDILDIE